MEVDFLETYNEENEYKDLLFYTPNTAQFIDDKAILDEIFTRCLPLKIAHEQKQEKEERKAFAEFLDNNTLINDLLIKYNLTIIDLIKLFYRRYSYIFNTVIYSTKLKTIIEKHGYRTELK